MDDHDSSMYRKLADFLDNIESTDPGQLSEPYRTLWFRIMDVDPSGRDAVTSNFDMVIEEPSSSREPGQRRIEVISPSSVGPTVEMKVKEEERIRFKAADEKDVLLVKSKEQGAKTLIAIQEMIGPLKGISGEPERVIEGSREIARLYREGDYEEMSSVASSLREKLADREFRQTIMIDLQRRIAEYSEIGADMSAAKERFREMAAAFKEERPDFISLAGSCHRLAEDAVSGILGAVEEAEVVVAELVKPRVKVKRPAEEEVLETPPPAPEAPGEEPAPTHYAPAQAPETVIAAPPSEMDDPDVKPIIKVVKKRLVAVSEGSPPETTPSNENAPVEDRSTGTDEAPEPEGPAAEPEISEPMDIPEDVGSLPAEDPPKDIGSGPGSDSVVDTTSDAALESDLQEAYKRISLVYGAASKMHAAGKDVRQLFDLYNFAEQARQKGDNKVYIGVSKQLESMLLSMQTK